MAEYSTQIAQTPQVSYLTTDHLGSPRVITDQNEVVTNRKDFSAFGEETISAQRTAGLKYQPDNIRQDYTGYEKDDESGLEFAQARYYNPTHGRFTSVDPLTASASMKNPQTFNRYSYVLNSPYKFVDPLGLISSSTGACGNRCANSDGSSGGGMAGLYSNNGESIQIGHEKKQQQSVAQQPPTPIKVNYVNKTYEVSGKTAKKAAEEANIKAAAGKTKKGRAGETELTEVKQTFDESKDIKYSPTTDTATGEVTVVIETTNVNVEATIITTLPIWKGRDKAKLSEQTAWDGFLQQLSDFEKEHTDDTTKRLNEYRDALIGLKATGTGSNAESAIRSAATSLSAQITAAQNTLFSNYNSDGAKRHQNGGHNVKIK